MRTDEHLHSIFSREPRWIYLLAQRPDPGPCSGSVSASVEQSLGRLTNQQLQDLLVALLNLNSLEDLTAWLARQDA